MQFEQSCTLSAVGDWYDKMPDCGQLRDNRIVAFIKMKHNNVNRILESTNYHDIAARMILKSKRNFGNQSYLSGTHKRSG